MDLSIFAQSKRAWKEELSLAYARIHELERLLADAHEALAWHDGLNFEPNDRHGKTIGQLIAESAE
jgi:hypothetical protein